MDTQSKIALLENRLKKLTSNEKENNGAQRKIRREIRNLEKSI